MNTFTLWIVFLIMTLTFGVFMSIISLKKVSDKIDRSFKSMSTENLNLVYLIIRIFLSVYFGIGMILLLDSLSNILYGIVEYIMNMK